ncbi:hypothetical protein QL285_059736 [Trifolium repens]|nr:hypothetical protein QL285_059736 [Trifolium repens]
MPANCHFTIFLIYVADIILTGDVILRRSLQLNHSYMPNSLSKIWAISISTFDFEIAVKATRILDYIKGYLGK